MKLPKRITPDRIKDSIVEFRYSGKVPHEVAIGMFFKSLDDTYTYTNRPITKPNAKGAKVPDNLFNLNTILGPGENLFFNERIKMQCLPNSLVFNCINEYIGWEDYQKEIAKALSSLMTADVIDKFTRIGIRYTTEYPSQDLQDCVKFNFSFGMPNLRSDTYSFQAEYKWDGYRIILRLKNKLPVNTAKHAGTLSPSIVSIIDIDVIAEGLSFPDVQSMLPKLDETHLKEKEVFFNLLNEDFLKNLNPIY